MALNFVTIGEYMYMYVCVCVESNSYRIYTTPMNEGKKERICEEKKNKPTKITLNFFPALTSSQWCARLTLNISCSCTWFAVERASDNFNRIESTVFRLIPRLKPPGGVWSLANTNMNKNRCSRSTRQDRKSKVVDCVRGKCGEFSFSHLVRFWQWE